MGNEFIGKITQRTFKAIFNKIDLALYALKSNVLELNNTDEFTPDADYEPATKKYVDDTVDLRALKSNVLELNNTDEFTPDSDYEPTTKKFVDDIFSNISHHDLSDLLSYDDHLQYLLIIGRSGGQTVVGGDGASENLTLFSTSSFVKGYIKTDTSNVGINTTTPLAQMHITPKSSSTIALIVDGRVSSTVPIMQINQKTNGFATLLSIKDENNIETVVKEGGQLGVGTNNPKAQLHSTTSTILGCADTANVDGDLEASQVNIWIDEGNDKLVFKTKYSDTSVKSFNLPQIITNYFSHTWTVDGEVTVQDLMNHAMYIASGRTVKLIACTYEINSGTSATFKLKKRSGDGAYGDITGFTSLSCTQTYTRTEPTAVTLADDDVITPEITAVSGAPTDMYITIHFSDTWSLS